MPMTINGRRGMKKEGTTMGFLGTVIRTAIRAYQLLIVPVLPAGGCRFHPTCSEYAMQAVTRHGAARGGRLTVKRILRCHPWGPSGLDAVPPRCDHARAGASSATTGALEGRTG